MTRLYPHDCPRSCRYLSISETDIDGACVCLATMTYGALLCESVRVDCPAEETKMNDRNDLISDEYYHSNEAKAMIEDSPSAAPQKRTGRWIHRKNWDKWVCSVCSHESDEATNYCPNCGARMGGERA